MADRRVDSGHETVTAEDDEDSITPKYSPVSFSDEGSDSSACAECKLSSRRYPITSEKDLYRVTPCKHESIQSYRSSSAIQDGGAWEDSQWNHHPPKLTDSLNHGGKGLIRPIAFKPTDAVPRFLPGTLKKALERHNSENTLKRNSNLHLSMELPPFPTKGFTGVPPDAQRFGGSLSNVLHISPSEQLHIRRIGSAIQIDATGTFPTTKGLTLDHWNSERTHTQVMYETNLKTAQQRANKLEQELASQSCQLQQERKKFRTQLEEALRRSRQTERMNAALRQEVDALRVQLEEVEWAMDLLKSQLKNSQGDQATRTQELRATLQQLATEATGSRSKLAQCTLSYRSKERENMILRESLMHEERSHKETLGDNFALRKRLKEMEVSHSAESAKWESERLKWADEQKRVLRYQKALQHNYVLACQKAQGLSSQLEQYSTTQPKSLLVFSQNNQNGILQTKQPQRS